MILTEIQILRQRILLTSLPSNLLKRISIGEKLGFDFYEGVYRETALLFIKPKGENPTPRNCQITASRMESLFNKPVVFILKPGPGYERQRLIEKGVFFVISNKYANLPMLIVNENVSSRKIANKITPVAQYLLLYHLEVQSLNGMSAMEITQLVPYSYSSVTLGLTCLDDLGIAKKIFLKSKIKRIQFSHKGKTLWDKIQPVLLNPVERRLYCDELNTPVFFPMSGIKALSHFSSLIPDDNINLAITSKEYKELEKDGAIEGGNFFDGKFILEIWKYPPIKERDVPGKYVDKLSLVLSLKDDHDPRVQKELEEIINTMQWTD